MDFLFGAGVGVLFGGSAAWIYTHMGLKGLEADLQTGLADIKALFTAKAPPPAK